MENTKIIIIVAYDQLRRKVYDERHNGCLLSIISMPLSIISTLIRF